MFIQFIVCGLLVEDDMRAVIQRCNWCRVFSEGKMCGEIGKGLVVLLGIKRGDTEEDALYISDKIVNLRIFEDENDKMNLSLLDTKGALMIVSQFTLYGDSRHGRRPSFTEAELPEQASRLYEYVVRNCTTKGIKVETGNFQTYMQVALENDGPVTLILDSKKVF